MNIEPLISIIVPVYNVENYLDKCITSIISQTYKNIEVLLVDDGSTDGSSDICKKYSNKDNRIKYLYEKNAGQASARNMGLDICKGEYIGFVDSDDWILPNMYEKLMYVMKETNVDIVMCNNYKDVVNPKENMPGKMKLYSKDEFMPLSLTDKINANPFDKLYKRHIFDKVRFPLGICAEDLAIIHLIMNNATKLAIISDKLYVYDTMRKTSTTNDPDKNIANSFDRAEIFREKLLFAEKYYPNSCVQIYKMAMDFYVSSYIKMVASTDLYLYNEKMNTVKDWIETTTNYRQYDSKLIRFCIDKIQNDNLIALKLINHIRLMKKKIRRKKKTAAVDNLI